MEPSPTAPAATEIRRRAVELMREKTFSLPFPRFLHVELTNACPLRCVMCPRLDARRPVGFIAWDLFRKIADECAAHGPVERMILHKDGEPLLHPGLPDMIAYAKRVGAARTTRTNGGEVSFSTSMKGMTRPLAEALVGAGLDRIHVSLDGIEPESYARIRPGGDLEEAEEATRMLLSVRDRLGRRTPEVILRIIRMDGIAPQIAAYRARWEALVDGIEVREMKTWGGRNPVSIRAACDRRGKRTPCFMPWVNPAVNWDGDVSICSVDYAKRGVLGNVRKQTLLEVWRGAALARIREAHLQGEYENLPACAPCGDWQPFDEFWEDVRSAW